jgi:thiol-disulfide isomerase/thioredoxin
MTVKTQSLVCMLLFLLSIILICATAKPVHADTSLRAFEADSLEKIQAAYKGKPFLLVLWSLDCPPCRKELTLLSAVKKRHPDFHLVLISTDASEQSAQVASILASHRLVISDAWLFSETSAERLRYAIDPSWYGEMPRSYFYDPEHNRVGVSGALKAEQIESWLTSYRTGPTLKTGS